MTDLLRYIDHPASTSTGAASWLYRDRPLGAGRHQSIVGSNALHLARINSVRPLCTHPGVRGVWQGARRVPDLSAPSFYDINWTLTPKSGGLALDLGVHWVWRYGDDTRYPVLRCDVRAALDNAGDSLNLYFAVAPGERFITDADTHDVWHHTGTTAYTEKMLEVVLGDSSVARRPVSMVGGTSTADPTESGELLVFRAFLGGFNSAGVNTVGRLANILGITLFLEPPV